MALEIALPVGMGHVGSRGSPTADGLFACIVTSLFHLSAGVYSHLPRRNNRAPLSSTTIRQGSVATSPSRQGTRWEAESSSPMECPCVARTFASPRNRDDCYIHTYISVVCPHLRALLVPADHVAMKPSLRSAGAAHDWLSTELGFLKKFYRWTATLAASR